MTFGAFVIMAYLGQGKDDAETFDSFRGLSPRRPLLALAMLVFMVSLAGIPPTAGFWAKLYLPERRWPPAAGTSPSGAS